MVVPLRFMALRYSAIEHVRTLMVVLIGAAMYKYLAAFAPQCGASSI